MSDVAVVTVTYNSSDVLEGFLGSLRDAVGFAGEVLVVDNDSADADDTVRISERFGARVLRLPDNVGYGSAVNVGVTTLSPGTDVLVANPDLSFEPGAIDALVATLAREPDAGAVGPRIINPDGTDYPSARNIPSIRTGAGHAVFATIWPRNPWTRAYRDERSAPDMRRDVGWLSGACLLVRRAAFDAISGFDGGYFMYFEDVDLGWRLGRAGWRNVYEPAASVHHLGGHSTAGASRRMLTEHHRSASRFVDTKYAAPWFAPLRWTVRRGLALRMRVLARGDRD